MEHGKFYTAEALRGLNAAYDAEYGITSLETDKVNGIIRCMDDTRKLSLVPQEGDLLEYFPQNGDYFPQAHIETAGKGRAAVCLSSRTPFCHMENGHVHYTTEGGPWTQLPLSGMIPAAPTVASPGLETFRDGAAMGSSISTRPCAHGLSASRIPCTKAIP